MTTPRILAFSGSARAASLNQQLVRIAARGAEQAGGRVQIVSLGDFDLPLFSEDLEAETGPPPGVTALKTLFLEHDGLLIASPEYNSSLTPLLKNAIDWVSRGGQDERPLAAYRGKTAAILAASPGELGGIRGLVHLRAILGNLGVLVLPNQVAIAQAKLAFDESGDLRDAKQQAAVEEIGAALVRLTSRLLIESGVIENDD